MKFLGLIFENIRRNSARSLVTALGTMVLVFVVVIVWSVLSFLDAQVTERSQNIKAIVTEKWRLPSQMPYSYRSSLIEGGARNPDDPRPVDYMTWTFYGGSTEKDRSKVGPTNIMFAFVMEPEKIMSMLDELDTLPPDQDAALKTDVDRLKATRTGVILGQNFLRNLGKQVGDRMTIYSFNYRGIDLEFEVVGQFPPGRYNNSAVIRRDYFNAAMEKYEQDNGKKHPLADTTLNLVWLKVNSSEDFAALADQIVQSPYYTNPTVKVETSASGVAAFLASYRDILWGARWILGPAILLTLSLVIANSISISVRERQMEFAVLKVLGFRPGQILGLVLGEALLIGVGAGLFSALGTYLLINRTLGGVPFPIAFYSSFPIPLSAVWWGAAIGAGTALVGSLVPAWSARTVKVSEVFSRVA